MYTSLMKSSYFLQNFLAVLYGLKTEIILNKRLYILLYCLLACLLIGTSGNTLKAQGFFTDFGKNRVQYHDFEWSFYESPNFIVYFYQGGKELGKFSTLTAEEHLSDVQNQLEYNVDRKIEILVYHNVSDQNQTNIGNFYENERNTGGTARVIGNKVFVYFDGNHQNLKEQIRGGIAEVYVSNMLFGDNVQEVLQNAFLLNLPDWFRQGLISYIGKGWNTELDNRLKDMVLDGYSIEDFSKLNNEQAVFAGHALWHYIANNYGRNTIPNLLYITRVNRSLESGFVYVIGQSLKTTIEDWEQYNKQLYALDEKKRNALAEENLIYAQKKKDVKITNLALSSTGKYLTFCENKNGRYKVWLYDLKEDQKTLLHKGGLASQDLPVNTNYPQLAWSKKGSRLVLIYQKRDRLFLMNYSAQTKEKEIAEITKFEQVIDVSFTDDIRTVLLSAVRNGHSDIYTYYMPTTRISQITNDYWDDLHPSFYQDSLRKGILFTSNRINDTLSTEKLDTILPDGNFDVFFYDLDNPTDVVARLTETEHANEKDPVQYTDGWISYTSDLNGIRNQYVGRLDSTFVRKDTLIYFKDGIISNNTTLNIDSLQEAGEIDSLGTENIYATIAVSYPNSNYNRNILQQDIAYKKNKSVFLKYTDGKYRLFDLKNKPVEDGFKDHNLKLTPYKQTVINQYEYQQSIKSAPESSLEENIKNDTIILETNGTESDSLKNDDIEIEIEDVETTDEVDTDDYSFETDFDNAETDSPAEEDDDEIKIQIYNANNQRESSDIKVEFESAYDERDKDEPLFKPTKVRTYTNKFAIESVTAQLDNNILFTPYEKYFDYGDLGELAALEVPLFGEVDLNSTNKYSISDLFEDYRIIGGYRFPLSFNGMEYFLEYQNFKKRLDKKLLYYRKSDVELTPEQLSDGTYSFQNQYFARNRFTYMQGSLIYPLDFARSIRGHVGWRNEKSSFISEEIVSLNLPDQMENWAFLKLEYIFDNTKDLALNLREGTRYKFYTEVHKDFTGIINDREVKFNLNKTGIMGIAGVDVRHYQRLYKKISLSGRFAAATSFGKQRMLYYLGGVENWINFYRPAAQVYDYTTPVSDNVNYVFQSQANQLRGFKVNGRNGNSFAIINTELRVPVLSTFSNKTVRSEFLRNFQVVPFFDFGTAWEGASPFRQETPFIQNTIDTGGDTGGVLVTVNYFRNPFIGGYGVGFRSKLFGYFLKYDFAWGIDNGKNTDNIQYLSFGLDF